MSPTNIAMIVGAIIAVILVMILFQLRERSRAAQVQQVSELRKRLQRNERLITGVPLAYMSPETKLTLIKDSRNSLEKAQALGEKSLAGRFGGDLDKYETEAKSGKDSIALDSNNEAAMKELRENLKVLFRAVQSFAKEGKLNKKSANVQLKQIRYQISRSLADAHIKRGQGAISINKLRQAIHHFHDASQSLSQVAEHPEAEKLLTELHAQIAELEKKATQQSQEALGTQKNGDGPSALSAKLDALQDEEDKWKRKQEYD